ncbi:MAG: hypothetical protein KDA24_27885, partial [Deltaproteobacteria bacterium]|nr:hypothetical protein [Deltaproteobacteria bacterium]
MRTLLVVVGLSLTSFGLAEGAELDLVYSGGLRGFSRTSARFELQDRMGPALEAAGVDVGEVEVLHGLLAQDDLELWPESGTLAAALAFAKSADRACDHGVLVDTWRTPTERFLPGPAGDDLSPQLPVPDGIRQSRRLHRCEGGGVVVNALVEPHAPAPDARPLDAFDIRTGFRWLTPVGTYLQLGHPRREPGRRLGVLRKALTAPGSRFVDSGDFLEGGQWAEDTLVADSRVIGFEVLE